MFIYTLIATGSLLFLISLNFFTDDFFKISLSDAIEISAYIYIGGMFTWIYGNKNIKRRENIEICKQIISETIEIATFTNEKGQIFIAKPNRENLRIALLEFKRLSNKIYILNKIINNLDNNIDSEKLTHIYSNMKVFCTDRRLISENQEVANEHEILMFNKLTYDFYSTIDNIKAGIFCV
jgi:hypothetical protein